MAAGVCRPDQGGLGGRLELDGADKRHVDGDEDEGMAGGDCFDRFLEDCRNLARSGRGEDGGLGERPRSKRWCWWEKVIVTVGCGRKIIVLGYWT